MVDRGYHVVSMTDPYGRILGFLDRNKFIYDDDHNNNNNNNNNSSKG
jgi:hypothetical protein